MGAPHELKRMKREEFLAWIEACGGTLCEPTNPYEVVRYLMWSEASKSRPATHIIYRRNNNTLTYSGESRRHYEMMLDGELPR